MTDTSWSKQVIAENYNFGRPLDSKIIVSLFDSIMQKVGFDLHGKQFLDAGCGSGRLLFPLVNHYSHTHFVGVDIAQEMLDECAHFLGKSSNFTLQQGSLLQLPFNDDSFDVVMVSSVLHALTDWHIALDELVRVTRHQGILVFISEQGDLYDIGLGRSQNATDSVLQDFWLMYCELRKKHHLDSAEASQVGIKWQLGNPEVIDYLKKQGIVQGADHLTLHWKFSFTLHYFMEIVKRRCWSSMFTADDERYALLVNDLESWVSGKNLDQEIVSQQVIRADFVGVSKG